MAASACGARSALEGPVIGGGGGAGGESGEGASPCGQAPATMLAKIDSQTGTPHIDMWVPSMTVARDRLYIGAQIEDGRDNGHGFVANVPVAGGELALSTSGLDEYSSGTVSHDASSLFFARPTFASSTITFRSVTEAPLDGGPGTTIESPVAGDQVYVSALTGTTDGVVWVVFDESVTPASSTVLRWDGSTTTVLGSVPDFIGQLAIVRSTIFLSSSAELYALRSTGGTVEAVDAMTAGLLIGANRNSLFFSPDGTTIVRRDEAFGEESTLASGITLAPRQPAGFADETHVYFATQAGLSRLGEAGGAVTTVASGEAIEAVTGDDCNVYYALPDTVDFGDVDVMAVGKRAL